MSTSMTMQRRAQRRVRVFVIVWTFLTLVVGLATFLAIYFNTPSFGISTTTDVNAALPQPDAEVVLVVASVTPLPTDPPTETPLPTETVETLEIVPTVAELDDTVEEMVEATTEQVVDSEPTTDASVAVAQAVDPTATEVILAVQPTATLVPPTATSEPTPTSTPLPSEIDTFEVGIQVQFSLDFNPGNQNGFYNSVSNDLGLGWVKTQVRWQDFEREPDVYDWSVLDLVLTSSQEFGIKQMITVVTAPDWSRSQGVAAGEYGPPDNNQDYVDFVLKILERYPGQIHGIEVWNEQNLSREWTSERGLWVPDYVQLLQDTYTAVKAVDPGIIIISGALAPTGFDDGVGAINDFRYMDLMIAEGMLDYADCIGAHHNGYNIGPDIRWDAVPNDPTAQFRGPFDNPHHSWSFRSTLEGYNNRIRAAGYETPLCVTEFGWAVSEDLDGYPRGFEFANDNTLEEQATWFPQAMQLMKDWGFVRLAFVWNFNYAPQAGWNTDNDNVPYSLIGPNWNFRPAYDAIREWQRQNLASLGQS